MPQPTVSGLTAEQLPALAALEREAPSPWSADQLAAELSSPHAWGYAASLADGTVIGYILGRSVVDEAEILRLAVARAHRRQGVGRMLLSHALDALAANAIQHCYLEVRAGNRPARLLYEQAGFAATARRRGYYPDTGEDAVVMTQRIHPKGAAP